MSDGGQAREKRTITIPAPARSRFPLLPRYRCRAVREHRYYGREYERHCHAAYWTLAGYRGHYALAHILEA